MLGHLSSWSYVDALRCGWVIELSSTLNASSAQAAVESAIYRAGPPRFFNPVPVDTLIQDFACNPVQKHVQ